jgi:hypothetical protein
MVKPIISCSDKWDTGINWNRTVRFSTYFTLINLSWIIWIAQASYQKQRKRWVWISAWTTTFHHFRSHDSLVGIVMGYGLDFQQGQEIFLFSTLSRLALGPTQPPFQWVLGVMQLGGGGGVWLTTHLHQGPRTRMVYNHSPKIRHGVDLN